MDEVRNYLAKIGRKGGKARLTTMTAEERKDRARKAAEARWTKEHEQRQATLAKSIVKLKETDKVIAEGTKNLKKLVAQNQRAKKKKAR